MLAERLIGSALLALLIGGCQQVPVPPTVGCDFTPMLTAMRQPGPGLAPAVAGTMAEVPLNAVSMTDLAITNKVLVQAVMASRTATGTVQVTTRMVNCTDFPLQVEGRTHFFDATQAPTEPVSAWRRVHLPARAIGTYQESSTDVRRVSLYLIELREGR